MSGHPFGSNSDYFDATTSPNDPVFFFQHAFYVSSYFVWANRFGYLGKQRPSVENDFGKYPTDPSTGGFLGACYGHRLSEAVNHNFCYTKHDLGIPDTRPACFSEGGKQTRLASFPVTHGQCCSHADVMGFVLDPEDKPISYDIEVETYSWHAVEPRERCSDDCTAVVRGEMICVKNPLYEQVPEELCTHRPKPEPPTEQCVCATEAIRERNLARHRELGTPSAVVACSWIGAALLVMTLAAAGWLAMKARSPLPAQAAGAKKQKTLVELANKEERDPGESERLIGKPDKGAATSVRRRSRDASKDYK